MGTLALRSQRPRARWRGGRGVIAGAQSPVGTRGVVERRAARAGPGCGASRWVSARSAVRVTQSGPVYVTETNSLELIVGNDFFGRLSWNRSGLLWIQSGLRKMKIFGFEIRLCTSGDCRSLENGGRPRRTVQTTDVRGESVRLKSAPCCERPSIGCWWTSCRRQRS